MRCRKRYGLGISIARTTAGEDFVSLIYLWRIEIDLLVWHWRIPLFHTRPP